MLELSHVDRKESTMQRALSQTAPKGFPLQSQHLDSHQEFFPGGQQRSGNT